jgi:hypothetical protein
MRSGLVAARLAVEATRRRQSVFAITRSTADTRVILKIY